MYKIIKNLMFCLQPETAHEMAMWALSNWHKCQILDRFCYRHEALRSQAFGLGFDNPIGIAAGFDKNATALNALAHLGFGFLEFGAVTPLPQSGNPKPRLYRLKTEESLQNAMGFNNIGLKAVLINLARQKEIFAKQNMPMPPLLANIGKNKSTPNERAVDDYVRLVVGLENACDGYVVNISSPNTAGLRQLQNTGFISELFGAIKDRTKAPCLLKIAPDMSAKQATKLCSAAIDAGANGVIINNTTQEYSLSTYGISVGGISGRLLRDKSRELLREVASELYGQCAIISSGGIQDASDVLWRLEHGASLVQIYTAFIYQGPGICSRINSELVRLLQSSGYTSISDAIGAKVNKAG